MILKKRTIPLRLLTLEALVRRLSHTHPKMPQIQKDLINQRSGNRGEHSIDYHLHFLPKDEYLILHDLRLKNSSGYFFQIDTLILSPYFITIIEVKNYSGTIQFDNHFNQLIQTYNNEKRALPNPTSQIRRHQLQLKEWMQTRSYIPPPIEPLIVISNPSTIIETTSQPSNFKHVTHSINIESKIKSYHDKHQTKVLSTSDLHHISNLLIHNHTPLKFHPLLHFDIDRKEILKGVHCPNCSSLPMTRLHGRWKCPTCSFISKGAHIHALKDYALLLGDTITNKEMCEFLKLSSRFVANRLFHSMNLPHSGGIKSRKYFLK